MDKITKAIRYITNIRDENYVKLDSFKKEIEANKDSRNTYNTSVYDNRIENCNTVLEALEKQVLKEVVRERATIKTCPSCDSIVNKNYCSNCGQKLKY